MKILQVATIVSRGGAFGGPVSVARAQCMELARRGHTVTFAAGWDGEGALDFGGLDVATRLFQARSLFRQQAFSQLVAPALLKYLHRHQDDFDLVHIHLGRDLITQGAARTLRDLGVPYVAQTHGMIAPDSRVRAQLMDRLVTVKSIEAAALILALNDTELSDLKAVAGERASALSIRILRNGIDTVSNTDQNRELQRQEPTDTPPDVLFVGRLHPRKRVTLFIAMARELVDRANSASFSIVGADHGDLAAARAQIVKLGLHGRVHYEGALSPGDVRHRMRAADVLVLPSAIEPFGMVAIEAMVEGTPVVMTDTCDIANEFGRAGAAMVTRSTASSLADAVQTILADAALSRRLVERGLAVVKDKYDIAAVVGTLESLYQNILNR